MREKHTVTHALHCQKEAYNPIKHNEIRDVTTILMAEVSYDVNVEPHLQALQDQSFNSLTTRGDDARLDIEANGVEELRLTGTHFDVKVFNPLAKSCRTNSRDV